MFRTFIYGFVGSFATPTVLGNKYFLPVVDDFSRFTWIILLKGKLRHNFKFKNLLNFLEN